MGFGAPLDFDLPTAPSQVTRRRRPAPGGFADDVELANASYGQAKTLVTPLQMALVAGDRRERRDPDEAAPRHRHDGPRRDAHGSRREQLGRRDRPDEAAAIAAAMQRAVESTIGRQFTSGAKVAGHPDGRQVRHGRARRERRAALVVHRLRPGRQPADRDRRHRRARRARRGARGAARRRSDGAVLPDVRPSERSRPDRPRPGRAAPRLSAPTATGSSARPWLERIGLAAIAIVMGALLASWPSAAWAGGEWILAAMSASGAVLTLGVGAGDPGPRLNVASRCDPARRCEPSRVNGTDPRRATDTATMRGVTGASANLSGIDGRTIHQTPVAGRPVRDSPRSPMTTLEQTGEKVLANVERVIVGKHHEVRLALVALLCRGHLLIEDVPGTGKTVLAKAIARSLGCSFRRIQFTPDLLPSDVTGLSIYNQKTQEFEFRPGPIMSQVVLADEINRATPKTQSSLLESMEERQATVDGTTYAMPDPFLVIATQNPIEYEGTFALPEAQLDRFMLRIRLGYPQPLEEVVILDEQKRRHPLEELEVVCSVDELRGMQNAIRDIYVDPTVADYIVRLVGGDPEPPRRLPRRVAARLDRPLPGRPGPGRAARPRLRDPRRHQGARRAGPRPSPDHQDELVDPRRPVGQRRPRAARLDRRSTASGRRGGPNGPRAIQPAEQGAASA